MKKSRAEKMMDSCAAAIRSSDRLFLLAQSIGAAGAAFLLSGVTLLSGPVPLALALPAALPFGLPAVLTFAAAAGGYLLFWGLADGLLFIGSGFLILSGLCIFRDLLPVQRQWFVPIAAGLLFILVGLVLLTGSRFSFRTVVFLLMQTALLTAGAKTFSAASSGSSSERGLLLLCIAAGTMRFCLPGGLPLGAILLCGTVFTFLPQKRHLCVAAFCGLTLDLCWQPGFPATGCLILAASVTAAADLSSRVLRFVFFHGCILSCVLFLGGSGGVLFVCSLIGCLLSLLAPARLIPAEHDFSTRSLQAVARLGSAFAETARLLHTEAAAQLEPQTAAVFDKAADEVCCSCARYTECWHVHASETYHALSLSAGRILSQGSICRDDLPPVFQQRCLRIGSFLAAVNDALDTQLARRQFLLRLRETRTIISDTFYSMAQVFSSYADEQLPDAVSPHAYYPELGFRAIGMRGASISGDRGVSFQLGEWYYLILCDGMGTGPDAAQESAYTISLIKTLIEAGFDAQDALCMLNGFYVLLDHGGFSSVDLLQLSLVSGSGYLHKWGSAPSYLKQDGYVKKIGTASPPPGLSVGETQKAACIRLSLQQGEQLILCSDGAAGLQAEQFLRGCGTLSARDLASGVVAASDAADPDDRMSAVLSLHPIPIRPKHSIRSTQILSKHREGIHSV
ncbi:MAG: SpoIIE family protein phosphatase [Clostridia bacterium]|nr:SpoIIE family protein phosphatase [Clostridia bacterium]